MDIQPGKRNISIQQGEDYTFPFKLKIKSTGLYLDLTDSTVYSQIREADARDAELIADFTTTVDGVATPNAAPTDNLIELKLTDAQTAAIEVGTYYYDVLIVDSNNVDTYWLEGRVTVHNSVTVKP